MNRSLCIGSLFIVSCGLCAAQIATHSEFAVMKNDVIIPDAGGELPMSAASQVFPSPGVTDDGCLVACRDAQGKPHMAFMPWRTLLGVVTARAWVHDLSLDENTVVAQVPVQLQPGFFLLKRGAKYPIVGTTDDTFTLLYTLKDFSWEFQVSKSNVAVERVEPEKDPLKLREQHLKNLVEDAKKEQEDLKTRLQSATEITTRLSTLIRQLNDNEIQNDQLKTKLAEATSMRDELAAYQPKTKGILQPEAGKRTEKGKQQGKLSAEAQLADLSTQTVRTLDAQKPAAESALEQAKALLAAKQAELQALRSPPDSAAAEKNKQKLNESLQEAGKKQAELAVRVQQLETAKKDLETLIALLDKTEKDNRLLQEQVQKLTAEIDKLRKKLEPAPQE